jgi:hypothetical protein
MMGLGWVLPGPKLKSIAKAYLRPEKFEGTNLKYAHGREIKIGR